MGARFMKSSDWPMRDPTFPYTRHYRCVGAAGLWLCLGFGVASVLVLLGPGLALDKNGVMRVLCSLAFAGCCALCFRVGIRYMFGHLIVDDEGMRVWPPGFGFSFRWDELERWKIVVVDPGGEGESVQIEMTLHSS